MDGKRFDELSRAFASGRTRRGVLKGLAGGLAAGVAALAGRGEAAAQRRPLGSACSRATQCVSFRCVDGVCCNDACTGQCEACNVGGAAGACTPVSGVPAGDRPACPGSGPCAATCDGQTTTHCAAAPDPDVSCGEPTCANGWQTTYACTGNGACAPTTTSCAPFGCDATGNACATGCTDDGDCPGNAFCLNGACVEDRPLGDDCATDAQCASGICADDVCCASACPGACQACNVAGNAGFCTEIPDGGTCNADGGICCDGECVDTDSSLEHCGQCDHACDLTPNGPCENEPICQAGSCTFTPQPGPNIVLCRDAVDICDEAEYCDGVSIVCPPDVFQPNTVECRPATDVCDAAEFCTGTGPSCPPDVFQQNTVECRAGGTGIHAVCDPPENCTGTSAACPPNVLADSGSSCETGNLCTADTCNADGLCILGQDIVTLTCLPPGICQDSVSCDPATGFCTIDFSEFGTPCENPDLCLNGGSCSGAGFCFGGTQVTCDVCTLCIGGDCLPVADGKNDGGRCDTTCCNGECCDDPTRFCLGGACVECMSHTDCSPTELCDTTGACVPEAINLQGIVHPLAADDDIRVIVNSVTVVDDNDGVATVYPPFNLALTNGDSIYIAADNVVAGFRGIRPYQLVRPSDGAVQVLDPVGEDTLEESGGGTAPDVYGEFYRMCFTVNLPPRT